MADLLQSAQQWLNDQLFADAGQVEFRRDGVTVTVPALRGRTRGQRVDADGAAWLAEMRDFLVRRADLTLNGVLVEPRRGDELIETAADGTRHVFRVTGPAGGPVWEWSDDLMDVLRIHTQYVGTE